MKIYFYIIAIVVTLVIILITYHEGHKSGYSLAESECQQEELIFKEEQIDVRNETLQTVVKAKKIIANNRNLERDALIDKL